MMDNTLSKALYLEMNPGEDRRILHEFNRDGEPCSQGKDPCMNIHRTTSGLKYYCHRCEEGGFIKMNTLSPMETLALSKMILKRKERKDEPLDLDVHELDIPDDCMPLTVWNDKEQIEVWNSRAVPWVAIHWLWQCGFMTPDQINFTAYWSPSYNRVIFPIFNHDDELDGWVGRNVDNSGSKYMTRKQFSKKSRLLFTCEGEPEVVFTEDIVSAIKVNEATGYTTIALLTTALSFSIVRKFKGREMFLWLDGNMMTKSIKKLMRMTSLGYYMHSVRTKLDPKEYTPEEIQEHLTVKED